MDATGAQPGKRRRTRNDQVLRNTDVGSVNGRHLFCIADQWKVANKHSRTSRSLLRTETV